MSSLTICCFKMTISEEILAIANQLANQGKQPSVALVKAKLSTNTPLPTIINILKSWQHDPNYVSPTFSQQSQNNQELLTPESRALTELISSALAPIEKELAEIKQLLNELIKKG